MAREGQPPSVTPVPSGPVPSGPPGHKPLRPVQMITYAAGTSAGLLLNTTVVTWVMYFYVAPPGEGRVPLIPIVAFTWIMLLGRIVDALADLPVAYFSDRTYSRFGRRMPYIIALGLPTVVVYWLLWSPPVAGLSPLNVIYFAVLINLFFVVYTAVYNPMMALLPEIARTNPERITLSTWGAFFAMITTAIASVGSGLLLERLGYRGMAYVLGGLALVLTYLPFLTIRETPKTAREAVTMGFWEMLLRTFTNGPFLAYVGNMALFYVGFNTVISGLPYYVTVILKSSEASVGLYMGAHLAAAMAFFPVMARIAPRIGKRRLYTRAIFVVAALFPLFFFIGKVPLPISPQVQGIALMALVGIPLSALYMLPNPLISDCVDYDELLTGKRREAMYYGVQNILQNAAMAFSAVLLGSLFNFFGYSAKNPAGIYLMGPAAGLCFLLAGLIFLKYPPDALAVGEWPRFTLWPFRRLPLGPVGRP
ncbi:MAG: MFS transporter [Bacillota bacterium]